MGRGIWDWVVVAFSGEQIALLGPRLAGKTTLHSYILDDGQSEPPEQTLAPEKTTWVRNKSLGLNVHKGLDLPGGEASYPDWERQFNRSSKIFYLFDACKTRTDPDYADRVRRDGKQLRSWGTDGKCVLMLGTHADTDPLSSDLKSAQYHDHIADLEVVAAFQTRAKVRGFAVGALTANGKAVDLLKRAMGKS